MPRFICRQAARANGTTRYEYVYHGSQLVQMKRNSDTLSISYDGNGAPMTLTYGSAVYYYVTNLQGDVVALLDGNGNPVVRYTYDAWGRPLSTTGSLATTVGALNPLRYRGYVYDTEWSLYYLQSRYYDADLGRFINADAFVSTGQGILGNNMFAYCGNNPVNYIDPMGYALIPAALVSTANRIAGDLEGIIGPYIELRKLTAGNPNYEVHHLVEKRFYWVDGIGVFQDMPNNAPSVILYKSKHKEYTASARRAFPYGSDYAELDANVIRQFYLSEYGGKNDWIDYLCCCFD